MVLLDGDALLVLEAGDADSGRTAKNVVRKLEEVFPTQEWVFP